MNKVKEDIFINAYNLLATGQKEAVDQIYGPVLVVAGPGTGKTQVLSIRIANILKKTDTKPESILCLTFTESASIEMKNRLKKFIGSDAYKVKIHTFHSFCNEVIQTNYDVFTFQKEGIQLDEVETIKIFQSILDKIYEEKTAKAEEFYLSSNKNKYFFINEIIQAIKKIKREGITVEELADIVNIKINTIKEKENTSKKFKDELKRTYKFVELSYIYQKYQEYILKHDLYDYEDMILKVIQEFKKNDDLLAKYQEKFLFILVDEYQDTNGSQNKILELLGSYDNTPNIFVVGDDDQSIYRFQGANVSNIMNFVNMFENVKVITLNQNFRSSQTILDASYSMIKNNTRRLENRIAGISKKLIRSTKSKLNENKIKYYKFEDAVAENNFISKKIKEILENGENPSEIGILYRNHKDADDIIDILLKNNIPIRVFSGDNVFRFEIIEELIELIKLINYSPEESNVNIFKILTSRFINLNSLDLFKILKYFKTRESIYNERLDLLEIISNDLLLDTLNIKEKEKIADFREKVIEWMSKSKKENYSIYELILNISYDIGITKFLADKNVSIEEKNAFLSFIEYVKSRNKIDPDQKLEKFLNDIKIIKENKISIQTREIDSDVSGVQLMTVHASKGMEFKHVFIIKFWQESWFSTGNKKEIKLPDEIYKIKSFNLDKNPNEDEQDGNEEDIRRLFYVALTRAKENVFITYSEKIENTFKKENPLILEIDSDYLEKLDSKEYEVETNEIIIQTISPIKKWSIEEKIFLQEQTKNLKISATILNSYLECPLKFLYENLIGVPNLPNNSLIIGTAVHKALEFINKQRKINKNYSIDEINNKIWESISKEVIAYQRKKELFETTKKLLKNFLVIYEKDKTNKVAEIEYYFGHKNIILESEDNNPIYLTGKIDLIEFINEKENIVKIVDYKTGSPKTLNDILGKTKSSQGKIPEYRQLIFYKLLTDLDSSFWNKNTNTKYKVEQVEIIYIEPSESEKIIKHSFIIKNEEVQDLIILIQKVTRNIRNLNFYGTEEFPLCGECEYCKKLNT